MLFCDFKTAFDFLDGHPMFNDLFQEDLYMRIVKVCPETNRIESDASKNTKIQFWLEHGPYRSAVDDYPFDRCIHDLELDCGGDTFEDAIINLANLVAANYNDDGTKVIEHEEN